MRYCITGTPRSRSAWLASLLCAHGSICHHDAIGKQLSLAGDYGVSDPGIACLAPQLIRAHCNGPIVMIEREAWRDPFEQWSGVVATDEFYADCDANLNRTRALATRCYTLDELEHPGTVAEIITLCTKLPANAQLIDLWKDWRIEQIHPSAENRLP